MDDIIITLADIQDIRRRFYQQLEQDPTLNNAEEINTSIQNFIKEGLLTKKIGSLFITDDARTPRFYILTKIHKKNNPG